MTVCTASEKQKRRASLPGFGQVSVGLFAVFCLLLILKNAEIAIEYISRGMLLCAKTVIPSLFPFMVLSELIVSGGFGNSLFGRMTKPLRFLFGLPASGCCAVLLGWLCGFPVGAKCLVLAFERGEISKQDAERALAFSNVPSSAFLISAVGVSLWENRGFGIALYAAVLITALLTGILFNQLQKSKGRNGCSLEPFSCSPATPLRGTRLFTQSVRSATGSMLLVCAYVIFFSALLGTLGTVLSIFHLKQEANAVLFCFFELSGGMSQAAALDNTAFGALLCAFAAGWSGLSVHCQVLSVCDGKGFSFRLYFTAKIFQSILTALLFYVLLHIFPNLTVPAIDCLK